MASNFLNSSHCAWIKSVLDLDVCNKLDRQTLTRKEIAMIYINESEALVKIARARHLRQIVIATALVYFRRFYVKNSFRDFDPRLVAPTCLFVASKVEECPLGNVKALVQELNTTGQWPFSDEDVLKCELLVFEGLTFHLVIYHCYPLLEAYSKSASVSLEMLWQIVNDAYFTNIPLQHAPHIIALGCIHIVAALTKRDLNEWFANLDVDHEAVWEVAKNLLDLYALWNTMTRESTLSLLGKASCAYTIAKPTPTSIASTSAARNVRR